MSFRGWFERVAGFAPHVWQIEVGEDATCRDRLLRIPTGFGKTAGAVLPWMHHRAVLGDPRWPARLVFCLPMRVLVEQTERQVRDWIERAGVDASVVALLGGRRESSWLENPERSAIVIGTQDMLLSRALARGYGSARGLWPIEMGMLHRDALWIVDEVQLMDVGLATTTQLHAFRASDAERARPTMRPTHTWWMSATLQPRWLRTVDFAPGAASIPQSRISAPLRTGGLWDVQKRVEVRPDASAPEEIASLAAAKHKAGATTLVMVNTVDRARQVHDALAKKKLAAELVHSRFRGAERKGWDFLRRDAGVPETGRIIVATQVIEAGVDISARTLITDIAPWASLVQRFGRCARYAGERGEVTVVGAPIDEKKALPYSLGELESASEALTKIGADVGPAALEAFEEKLGIEAPALLEKLYPYAPLHVLRRRDFDDLFDTTPDLSGADLDVSRYIRSGDERDVTVFWRPIEGTPRELDVDPPAREELCPVPVGALREFLDRKPVAFVADFLTGKWRRPERLVPGMTVLLPSDAGGYDAKRGWDPKSAAVVAPVISPEPASRFEATASTADDEDLSASAWKTIATHGREAGEEASKLALALGLDAELARLLDVVGRWHDAGKAHATFQAAITRDARAAGGAVASRQDLAKAPRGAWRKPAYPERPGFRHELVSTLMMLELLRRAAPEHPGVLGAHRDLLVAIGIAPTLPAADEIVPNAGLARQLADLTADDLDLALYLVCAHHGKVRTSWSTTPNDQRAGHGDIHGVRDGDEIGALRLAAGGGERAEIPALSVSLASAAIGVSARYGASWGERVARLLDRYGPFTLAYLEGLFRIADWRASQLETPEDA